VAVLTTLKTMDFGDARRAVEDGAAFVDLRPIDKYLAGHIHGSLPLLYEAGPGMPSRARDCLPLDLPLVLMDTPRVDMSNAAAGLRGKGFSVLGHVENALERWRAERGGLVATDMPVEAPDVDVALDVGDPGARPPAGATRISVERLWADLDRLEGVGRIVVISGIGVRAALAVGMLERAGVKKVQIWRSDLSSQLVS
jgi:rhodanese-related sulfurtransferase